MHGNGFSLTLPAIRYREPYEASFTCQTTRRDANSSPRFDSRRRHRVRQPSGIIGLERAVLAALLGVCILLLPEAIRARLWVSGLPGPGLYPLIVLGLIAIAGAALLLGTFLQARSGSVPAVTASPTGNQLMPLTVGLSLLVFPFAMPLVGFRALAFAYTLVLAIVLSPVRTPHRIILIAAFSAALAFGVHLLFSRVFRVVLPAGSLTGF